MSESAAEEQLRLIEHSPVALVAVNLNGEVLAHNRQMGAWLGAADEPGSLRGRNLVEWLTPASRLLYESQVVPRLLELGRVHDVILEMRGADGAQKSLLASAKLSPAADSARVINIAVIDASARISFERELVASRRSADAAHERLALLQEATSQLAIARGIYDLGEILVNAAGRASRASWSSVRLLAPADETTETWHGALPSGISSALLAGGSELVACEDSAEISARFPELAGPLAGAGVEALLITPIVRFGAETGSSRGDIVCAFRRPTSFENAEIETLHALAALAERVIEHLHLQEQIRQQALHDALTGLPNRRHCTERLAELLSDVTQSEGACSVFFIDLDGFKSINDVRGHAAGDTVLREVAGRLRALCRADDTVSRFGGDEFVIAVPGMGESAAADFAARVQSAIRVPLSAGAAGMPLSGSIGAISWQHRGGERAPSADELIAAADQAMYAAKRDGKDAVRLRLWNESLTDNARA